MLPTNILTAVTQCGYAQFYELLCSDEATAVAQKSTNVPQSCANSNGRLDAQTDYGSLEANGRF